MRIRSGIEGLEAIIGGGLPANRLYIVSGPPGSGKTTFAVQFLLGGLQAGDQGLFLSMHETRAELARAFDDYEFDLQAALGSRQLEFVNVFSEESRGLLQPAEESDYRTSLENQIRVLTDFIDDAGIDRLVLDSTLLIRHFYSDDSDTFIQFLMGLKRVDATVILVSEMTDPTAYSDDHYLAHGLIFLHNFLDAKTGGMRRGLQVIKMRGSNIDTDIHELVFTEHGLAVPAEATTDA